jgi:outer membrane biosynthesis protein TonB
MAKGLKRKAQQAAIHKNAWKKVHVELDEPASSSSNHYDETSNRKRSADRDLEANPKEDVAMFYGLEVLDSSQYQVETTSKGLKQMRFLTPVAAPEPVEEEKMPEESVEVVEPTNSSTTPEEEAKKKKKNKKKKKKKKAEASKQNEKDTDVTSSSAEIDSSSPPQQKEAEINIDAIQTQWCIATGGVTLHPVLCQALQAQSFTTPTPIQAAALPAAILGRRNMVGAAPTGSGKTLAFMLPIAQFLLEQQTSDERSRSLQALIMTPTRELALQIQAEGRKLFETSPWNANKMIGCIVGGLALAKQARVLEKDRPPILVGTVGRLWELVRSVRVVYWVDDWLDWERAAVFKEEKHSHLDIRLRIGTLCRPVMIRQDIARQSEIKALSHGIHSRGQSPLLFVL